MPSTARVLQVQGLLTALAQQPAFAQPAAMPVQTVLPVEFAPQEVAAPAALQVALPVAAQPDEPWAVAAAEPEEQRAVRGVLPLVAAVPQALPLEVVAAVLQVLLPQVVALRALPLEAAAAVQALPPEVAAAVRGVLRVVAVVPQVLPLEAAAVMQALPPEGVAAVLRVLLLEVERPAWLLAAAERPFSSVLRFAPVSAQAARLAQITAPCRSNQFARQRTARHALQPKLASPPRRHRRPCRPARAI
jgi:hypothetical protein